MNKTHIFLSTLALVLINSFLVKAQENDRLVLQNGDSLICELKIDFWGYPSKYRLADSETFIKLQEKEIKYYYLAKKNEAYRSVKLPNKNKYVLLPLVEQGSICLYAAYSQAGTAGRVSTWYISKNDDDLHELKTSAVFGSTSKKDRQDVFADMLADKPEVLQQYRDTNSFNFKNIRNLVHLYNTGQPYKDTRSLAQKLKSAIL